MLKTLQRLEEDKKFSKNEAEQIIRELCFGKVTKFNHKVVGLMTGFDVEVKPLGLEDKEIVLSKRRDVFKGQMKAYQKELEQYEKETLQLSNDVLHSFIEKNVVPVLPKFEFIVNMSECPRTLVLTPHPYGRNHKEGYKPLPMGILKFQKMVDRLAEYQVFNVELRGKTGTKQEKDEKTLMNLYDPVFRQQGHVFRAWQEILVDYQLGQNSVIFSEVLKDYANFIGYLTEYKKLVNKHLKSEKRLMDIYNDILSDFDPKYNWFGFALEDAMLLSCVDKDAKVPCDLSGLKKEFWTKVKESSKEAREFFEQ